MLISRNPAATLELSYAWQKLQPSNIDAVKETDYVVRGGQRNRLTRDKKGNILTIPTPRHDVPETKRSRASTTERVFTGTLVGRVLAAASNQPEALANLLRFLYDPECPMGVLREVEHWASIRMQMILPKNVQQARRDRAALLVWPLLLDFSQRLRGGMDRYTEAQLCQHMGFVNKQDAHYDRDYKRLVGDFMLQMQDAENQAMAPVCKVVELLFREPHQAHQLPVAVKVEVASSPPAKPFTMNYGYTLSLRRPAAKVTNRSEFST